MQQIHSQMYREYRDPYAYHNSMQSSSVGEFINPWQLQGVQRSMHGGPSLYHSRQFVQSPNSQMMHRQALVSEVQGSAGDNPQINYFTHREGSNQMPIQGSSPQNQSLRERDRQSLLPSDQGMLSIGTQGGTSNPQSDRHSGSEPFANMAIERSSTSTISRCNPFDTAVGKLLDHITKVCNDSHFKWSARSYCHDCNSRKFAAFKTN
jgi:hypothetical protein